MCNDQNRAAKNLNNFLYFNIKIDIYLPIKKKTLTKEIILLFKSNS